MASEQLRTRTGVTWMDDELGILRFVYDPGSVCTLRDAQENVETQLRASGGRIVPILCDISKAKAIDQEARRYYGDSESFRALALITSSAIGNMIGNIFLAAHGRRATPTKLFSSEADALQWLKKFIA